MSQEKTNLQNKISKDLEEVYDKEISQAKIDAKAGKAKLYTDVDEMIESLESD